MRLWGVWQDSAVKFPSQFFEIWFRTALHFIILCQSSLTKFYFTSNNPSKVLEVLSSQTWNFDRNFEMLRKQNWFLISSSLRALKVTNSVFFRSPIFINLNAVGIWSFKWCNLYYLKLATFQTFRKYLSSSKFYWIKNFNFRNFP